MSNKYIQSNESLRTLFQGTIALKTELGLDEISVEVKDEDGKKNIKFFLGKEKKFGRGIAIPSEYFQRKIDVGKWANRFAMVAQRTILEQARKTIK